MNEVGLTYRGRPLYTDPGFQIDWEVQDDLMNPLRLGFGFSGRTQIPVKGNERVFNFASDPANSNDYFKQYDGFAITVGGNIWWSCTFDLIRVSPDGRFYEGTLSTISSTIDENQDKSIAEILEGLTWTYPAGGYPTVYPHFNGNTNRGIRFPWVHFYNEFSYNTSTGDKISVFNTDVYAVPFFHLKHIVELTLNQLGYSIRYNLTNSDFEKVLINTARTFGIYASGGTETYSRYMPTLSVKDLLLELVFYTSGKVYIDEDNKTITCESLAFNVGKNTSVDLQNDLSETTPPAKPQIENILAEYAFETDSLFSDAPNSLEGNYTGVYFTSQSYRATPSPSEGDYGYCKFENAYYKWINVDDTLRLEYYTHPFIEQKTGVTEILPFTSKFSPVARTNFAYAEFDVDAEVIEYDGANGAFDGKLKIRGFEDSSIVLDYDWAGIIEFKTREKKSTINRTVVTGGRRSRGRTTRSAPSRGDGTYAYGLRESTTLGTVRSAVASPTYYIGVNETILYPVLVSTVANEETGSPEDTSITITQEYIADADVSKLKLAKQLTAYVAMIGKQLERVTNRANESGGSFKDTSGSVSLWHGMQISSNGVDDYPLAGPDNFHYDLQADEEITLDSYSLNLHNGTNNIWDILFNPFYELVKDYRIINFTGYLSTVKLKNLYLKKLARYKKGVFRFKSFRALLTRRGIRDQEIEGYGL